MYAKTARDRVIWRTDWWIPAKLWSCMYLAEPMNWLDFGVTRSKVKGHRAHYVCKNSSWLRYLKNRLMNSCQTLGMYVSCRANELIRFWGHEVKGQRSQGSLCKQKQLVIALSQEPIDWFLPNLVMYVTCRADELIRFWGHKVKGQRPQRTLCIQTQLVIALSQEPIDGFLPKLGHVCYLQSRWTD